MSQEACVFDGCHKQTNMANLQISLENLVSTISLSLNGLKITICPGMKISIANDESKDVSLLISNVPKKATPLLYSDADKVDCDIDYDDIEEGFRAMDPAFVRMWKTMTKVEKIAYLDDDLEKYFLQKDQDFWEETWEKEEIGIKNFVSIKWP